MQTIIKLRNSAVVDCEVPSGQSRVSEDSLPELPSTLVHGTQLASCLLGEISTTCLHQMAALECSVMIGRGYPLTWHGTIASFQAHTSVREEF